MASARYPCDLCHPLTNTFSAKLYTRPLSHFTTDHKSILSKHSWEKPPKNYDSLKTLQHKVLELSGSTKYSIITT